MAGIAVVQIEAGSTQEGLVKLKCALAGANVTQNGLAKSDILYRIAVCQAKAGDVAGALQTTELVEIVAHKNHALREIAVYQANAGEVKEALQTTSRFNAEISGLPYMFSYYKTWPGQVRSSKHYRLPVRSTLNWNIPRMKQLQRAIRIRKYPRGFTDVG